MGQNIDERIRKKLQQSQIDIPEGYEQNIDKLLNTLSMDKKCYICFLSRRQAVAVVLAIGLLFSSVGVYAAVNYVKMRMEAMEHAEMVRYRDDAQKADVDRDIYSRKFSESEAARIEKLKTDYQSKGVYPKYSLNQAEVVDSPSEWDTIVFSKSESVFYLPDRELTDEEILELIDFYYKRDYSITHLNKDIADNTKGNEKVNNIIISEEEALEKAIDVAKEVLGLDVTKSDYVTETLGFEDNLEENVYIISFQEKGRDICEIIVNAESGIVTGASNLSEKGNSLSAGLSEKNYIEESYQTVLKVIEQKLGNQKNIKSAYVKYYEDLYTNRIEKGIMAFSIELENGAGYVIEYSCNTKHIRELNYLSIYDKYEERTKVNESFTSKSNLIKRIVQLKK